MEKIKFAKSPMDVDFPDPHVRIRPADSSLSATLKKASFGEDLNQLVGMVVDTIFKLNEMGRALSINPPNAIDIARDVQTLERQVDAKHRAIIVKVLNEISSTKDLLLLKDAVEGIEGMVDKCQEASDSFTILALSM